MTSVDQLSGSQKHFVAPQFLMSDFDTFNMNLNNFNQPLHDPNQGKYNNNNNNNNLNSFTTLQDFTGAPINLTLDDFQAATDNTSYGGPISNNNNSNNNNRFINGNEVNQFQQTLSSVPSNDLSLPFDSQIPPSINTAPPAFNNSFGPLYQNEFLSSPSPVQVITSDSSFNPQGYDSSYTSLGRNYTNIVSKSNPSFQIPQHHPQQHHHINHLQQQHPQPQHQHFQQHNQVILPQPHHINTYSPGNNYSAPTDQIVTTKLTYSGNDLLAPILSAASETSFDTNLMIPSPEMMSIGLPVEDEFRPPYPTPPDHLNTVAQVGGLTDPSVHDFLSYSHQNKNNIQQQQQQQQRQLQSNQQLPSLQPRHQRPPLQHLSSTPTLGSFTPELASSIKLESSTSASDISQPPLQARQVGPYRKYRVVRGISSGGSVARPPKANSAVLRVAYVPVNLKLSQAKVRDLCLPEWDEEEKEDKRRIIWIERTQVGGNITASFSIVGSAKSHPKPVGAAPGVDVVEVSCLKCLVRNGDDSEDEFSLQLPSNDNEGVESASFRDSSRDVRNNYYITSVEVIKIVELLIGTEVRQPAERRRERGRIRSNLVPFWSKKPISTRMSTQYKAKRSPSSSPGIGSNFDMPDFRIELAQRIMAYGVRKPRGFDKDVRILKWEKLEPALRRALQSYYVEIPDEEVH